MANRRHHISARPLARFLLPLLAAVALVVVVFGRRGDDIPPQPRVEGSQGRQVLRLHGEFQATATDKGARDYRPLSTERRETVLQRLAEFHRLYRQSRPFMTVTSEPGSAALDKLARDLGALLARVDLGGYEMPTGSSSSESTALSSRAPVLQISSRHLPIALDLFQALEPLLAGVIQLKIDDTQRIDQLRLHLRGNPLFSGEGEAHFITELESDLLPGSE
jgi:hypothetical protein